MKALMSNPEEEADASEDEPVSYTEDSSFTLGDLIDTEE